MTEQQNIEEKKNSSKRKAMNLFQFNVELVKSAAPAPAKKPAFACKVVSNPAGITPTPRGFNVWKARQPIVDQMVRDREVKLKAEAARKQAEIEAEAAAEIECKAQEDAEWEMIRRRANERLQAKINAFSDEIKRRGSRMEMIGKSKSKGESIKRLTVIPEIIFNGEYIGKVEPDCSEDDVDVRKIQARAMFERCYLKYEPHSRDWTVVRPCGMWQNIPGTNRVREVIDDETGRAIKFRVHVEDLGTDSVTVDTHEYEDHEITVLTVVFVPTDTLHDGSIRFDEVIIDRTPLPEVLEKFSLE